MKELNRKASSNPSLLKDKDFNKSLEAAQKEVEHAEADLKNLKNKHSKNPKTESGKATDGSKSGKTADGSKSGKTAEVVYDGEKAGKGQLFSDKGQKEFADYNKKNNAYEKASDAAKEKLKPDLDKAKAELHKVKNEQFGKLGFVDKMKARFSGTFGEANKSAASKGFRGAGIAVGLGAMIDGTRRIIAPERDEKGERKDGVWAAVGEAGAGAAAIALSLKGGANRAMGI